MSIKIEDLENRKNFLQGELEALLSKANALSGAIQDCDYWISELQKSKKDEEVKEIPPS